MQIKDSPILGLEDKSDDQQTEEALSITGCSLGVVLFPHIYGERHLPDAYRAVLSPNSWKACPVFPELEDSPMTNEQRATIDSLRSQGLGYKKIAAMISVSPNTVKSYLRKVEPARTEKPAPEPLPTSTPPESTDHSCDNCGKAIEQVSGRKRKRFCSDACRNAWWNQHLDQVQRRAIYHFACPVCGKEFSAYGNAQRKYCSRECYFAARYGGGR